MSTVSHSSPAPGSEAPTWSAGAALGGDDGVRQQPGGTRRDRTSPRAVGVAASVSGEVERVTDGG